MNAPVSFPKALWRGFTMKCPNCGQGHLFGRFLKVVDSCEICGEDYTPQRADDLPAYLVIAVVGHLVVPALLAVEMAYSPPVWLQLLIWVPVTGLAAIFLLQPVKGTIVGLQWQTGMQGFEAAKRRRDRETRDGVAPLPNRRLQGVGVMKAFLNLLRRFSLTGLMVLAALWAGYKLWDYYLDAPWTRDGHVRADVVPVAPDVSGFVTEVLVRDNQQVQRGDVLFRIDRARYEIALKQAEAVLLGKRASSTRPTPT